jgi:transposase
MLGRRNPQRNLFEAQTWPHRVPTDSFYARMASVNDQLFADDDLAPMYCLDNGRPSLPPSLLSGVLLLQFYDDVSDDEAVERMLFDLRWKVALNLSLDCPQFDPSSLSRFRKRLLAHGQERYAFDRLIAVGRTAGLLPDKVTLLADTTWAKGAGAVQDTYTLIRKGIRKLLRQMGYATPQKRHGLAPAVQRLLATYVEQDQKAEIDWSDPQQRAAQLQVLVQDAEAALELAAEQADDAEVRHLGWLLTKILGDDVVTGPQGDAQLGEGTAPDRILSLTEPEMRHGHKSKAQRFDGFKTALTTEVDSELILDVAELAASSGDGQHLLPTVQRVEAQAGVTVERVIGDGAYPTGPNLAACATHTPTPIDVIAPSALAADPVVAKAAFQIDLLGPTATCPQGISVTGRPARRAGQPGLQFRFARTTCQACSLFTRCVQSKLAGRTIRTDDYEPYRQTLRHRQGSPEFKALYRRRSRVERKQAELMRHGLRRMRYWGAAKRQLQRLWTGAVVNLKRLFKLAQSRGRDLCAALARATPLIPRQDKVHAS